MRITEKGDRLRVYPEGNMEDKTLLAHCFAVHHVCGGFVDLKPTTDKYNAIVCRACHLRVLISNRIETFGELRQYMIATLQ